ncbi:MAG: hypothetical protein OMM_12732, partial [Candidatus Magnetoglobus multicellularis str. Araruama]
MGLLEQVLLTEELCKKDGTMGGALMFAASGSECLHHFGEKALKEKFLPMVTEGKIKSGAALRESTYDYDITTLATTAERDGENFIINGTKPYVYNAGQAGFYVVLAQTDP